MATLLVLDVLMNDNNTIKNDDHGNINGGADSSNTHNLYLWTFGAPQVADTLFLQTATLHSKKLRNFLGITSTTSVASSTKNHRRRFFRFRRYRRNRDTYTNKNNSNTRKRYHDTKQYHRFVTLSDDGKVDVVSEVARKALAAHKEYREKKPGDDIDTNTNTNTSNAPSGATKSNDNNDVGATSVYTVAKSDDMDDTKTKKKRRSRKKATTMDTFHGKVATSLGGVSRGSNVTHFLEPHYLWTIDQQQRHDQYHQQPQHKKYHHRCQNNGNDNTTTCSSSPPVNSKSTTRSSVTAHSMSNYLMGIAREDCCHNTFCVSCDKNLLFPDVPKEWLELMELIP